MYFKEVGLEIFYSAALERDSATMKKLPRAIFDIAKNKQTNKIVFEGTGKKKRQTKEKCNEIN